ncbi:MAG TPA: (d)CMP kinase [Bdellovibrionota bacterium]|jgi:cytidylate kinase|nr:(d)CMP kinase [Bdellovibrionota bacterium]
MSVMAIPKKGPVVAIDGPAGTGKSSVTKRLAEILGFVHVDTGALYRCVALLAKRVGMGPEYDDELLTELARKTHLEFRRRADLNPANRVLVNGEDVTDFIRTPEVSMAASRISAVPGVRAALLGLQRTLGCAGPSILEGRDIGTVIFPDADVKFFLTASVEERAKRRLSELEAQGKDIPSYEEVKNQISQRDRQDSERAVAPLRRAQDAVEIDTSELTLDEVVDRMAQVIRERLGK